MTKPDGTMARLPDALAFGESRGLPIVAVDDVARLLSKAPLGD